MAYNFNTQPQYQQQQAADFNVPNAEFYKEQKLKSIQ